MAVIKSGNTTDLLTIDPASKAARTTLYDSNGNELTSLPVAVSNFPSIQPVSAASLPLPADAASETTLAAIKAQTDQLSFLGGGKLKTNAASPTDVQLVDGSGVTQPISGSVSVSNFPGTQPVSGTVAVSNFPGTQTVSGTITARDSDYQTLLGVYYYHGGVNLVQQAADAATAGRFWLINPVGSGVTVRIKSIEFASQLGSALAAPTSPRILIERVTFTGTASGASLSPAKRKTSDASPQSSLRTASTGLTLTAGNPIVSFLPVASATAVGYTNTAVEKWKPFTEDRIDLVAGEGIVCRQADAGTNADTRRYTVDITVEEF